MQMGKDVISNLEKIVQNSSEMNEEESKKFVKDLENNKKIIKELWG